jgi:hypothetical protein
MAHALHIHSTSSSSYHTHHIHHQHHTTIVTPLPSPSAFCNHHASEASSAKAASCSKEGSGEATAARGEGGEAASPAPEEAAAAAAALASAASAPAKQPFDRHKVRIDKKATGRVFGALPRYGDVRRYAQLYLQLAKRKKERDNKAWKEAIAERYEVLVAHTPHACEHTQHTTSHIARRCSMLHVASTVVVRSMY